MVLKLYLDNISTTTVTSSAIRLKEKDNRFLLKYRNDNFDLYCELYFICFV